MDVLFFLKQRTSLIRHFYETASVPFLDLKRKIEGGEHPFEPPYSEYGEPPFLEEWLQADVELELLGRTCVSMLSDSLKLFFGTWERTMWAEPPCQKCFPGDFRKGFLAGYLVCFGKALNVERKDCPADLEVLEQVILLRNRSQHPEVITSLDVSHDESTRKRYPSPFFARPSERETGSKSDSAASVFLDSSAHVSRDNLFTAIRQVELLAAWMDGQMIDHRYRHLG